MKTHNVDTLRTLPPHFTMGNQTPDNQAQAAGLLIVACGAQGAMVARVAGVRSWVTDN